ncbi:uncharacterized protein PGTG_19300 [Puccinia graminis f. sp. tritici CRL 75-36-700-3]|uniref:Uncharacterized protein n=1 Tax=Puccinia graminis f. sp. tritici (strain CRL 75-36-700-3 / race SCCL) TaxID=418459 RepID=E3L9X0_PUCGT|nr:uncharacterized protein PGTG_19300 [Puccinia graminis f. sp. tritici CRL 75-36-700-3]EFP93345.1 hypothetical protein PGTG_19300 [Puccinia graminis f. sp. tritici CRL 75-36-700-3]
MVKRNRCCAMDYKTSARRTNVPVSRVFVKPQTKRRNVVQLAASFDVNRSFSVGAFGGTSRGGSEDGSPGIGQFSQPAVRAISQRLNTQPPSVPESAMASGP